MAIAFSWREPLMLARSGRAHSQHPFPGGLEWISSAEAIAMARRPTRAEGILAGISSAAPVEACAGQTLVVVPLASGERDLSTALIDGIFNEQGLAQ